MRTRTRIYYPYKTDNLVEASLGVDYDLDESWRFPRPFIDAKNFFRTNSFAFTVPYPPAGANGSSRYKFISRRRSSEPREFVSRAEEREEAGRARTVTSANCGKSPRARRPSVCEKSIKSRIETRTRAEIVECGGSLTLRVSNCHVDLTCSRNSLVACEIDEGVPLARRARFDVSSTKNFIRSSSRFRGNEDADPNRCDFSSIEIDRRNII